MAKSHPGSSSHPSILTHRQQNGKIQVKNRKGSKLGPQNVPTAQQEQSGPGRATALGHNPVLVEDVTEVAGGPVLRPNPATSLELQQLMRVMETMAQTMATQNAQINERFDRWLGQQNGQNGNQGAPNGVPAAVPQVEA
ncbi:unnamed protein product [Prunus armeniaca]